VKRRHISGISVAICIGVFKLDWSGLPEVRLIYMYAKLRAPSLIIRPELLEN